MEDEYFKRQVAKITCSNGEDGWKSITNDNPIYIAMKLVARDQRHVCAEATLAEKYLDCHTTGDYATRAHSVVMNATIKTNSSDKRKVGIRI